MSDRPPLPPPLPPDTRMGAVTLRVRDLPAALRFWRDVMGLHAREDVGPSNGEPSHGGAGPAPVSLEAGEEGPVLVRLEAAPAAPARPAAAPGLFHVAFLVPDRPSLGRALLSLREAGWPLAGAADHHVSEALYLADPEGNGVEIYADRPRETWRRKGGSIHMTTAPLDVRSVVAAAAGVRDGGLLPEGTRVGHVHLRVSALALAEGFWGAAGIGLDVTTRAYPGALFLAAGGYHHHLGANVWGPRGAARPEGALGLERVTVEVSSREALDGVARRLGGAVERREEGALDARDGDGLAVRVAVA